MIYVFAVGRDGTESPLYAGTDQARAAATYSWWLDVLTRQRRPYGVAVRREPA